MGIKFSHNIDGLARDLETITRRSGRALALVVRDHAREGNRIAKADARRTAGRHGKHYPKAFRVEAETPFKWVYGPLADLPQGDMSFEGGSRNQRPHSNLAKSVDIIGPKFGRKILETAAEQFWPGSDAT